MGLSLLVYPIDMHLVTCKDVWIHPLILFSNMYPISCVSLETLDEFYDQKCSFLETTKEKVSK